MRADTIYALSSGRGRAGVAVIRLSGPQAFDALKALGVTALTPRAAKLATLRQPATGSALDRALVIAFPAPRSFTGEDVAELHVHGGSAIIKAVCAALSGLGCRMAEPGEFTRRAFHNDKMDLTEAEGLADLIDAETESQRAQALQQMEGGLFRLYEGWRAQLLRIMAHVEADIDFPEEDLPPDITQKRLDELDGFAAQLDVHLADARRGERLREGVRIAILGAPNAGKSSLLNALAQRDVAIVSARAGTTRDVLEAHLDLGGHAVIVADTAGLRETDDVVEEEGIRRALVTAQNADVKLVLFDSTQPPDEASLQQVDARALVVLTKADLEVRAQGTGHGVQEGGTDFVPGTRYPLPFSVPCPLSVKTGEGLPALLAVLTARVGALAEGAGDMPLLTRPRHREAVQHCLVHVHEARTGHKQKKPPELIAEDLRLAAQALGRITGRVDAEALLDVIFRDFCVGK